jgi:hypothetical protein
MNHRMDMIGNLLPYNRIDDAKKFVDATNINEITTGVSYNTLMLFIIYSSCTIKDVDYLIDLGININAVDRDNETALHAAVRHGKIPIILHLLKLGCATGIMSTIRHGAEIDHAIKSLPNKPKSKEITWILYSHGARPIRQNMEQMNELIAPYIQCSNIAYLLIGIRKFRRSTLSQHPKEIILMIGGCVARTRKDPKWTM